MVLVVQSFSWPWRFFSSDRVLLTWSKVKDSRTYAGLSVDDLSSVVEKLDMLGNVLRDLSIILAKDWNRSIPEARIKHASAERQLTPAEAAQARLVWRLARKGFFSARRRRRELVHRRGHLRSSGSGVCNTAVSWSLKLYSIVGQGTARRSEAHLLFELRRDRRTGTSAATQVRRAV